MGKYERDRVPGAKGAAKGAAKSVKSRYFGGKKAVQKQRKASLLRWLAEEVAKTPALAAELDTMFAAKE